jgi:hypothetical protein
MGWATGFKFPREARYFSLLHRLSSGPTQPYDGECVLGALSLGFQWLGCEAVYSPLSGTEVNSGGAIPTLPHTSL